MKYKVSVEWGGFSRGTSIWLVEADSVEEAEDNYYDGEMISKTVVRDDTEAHERSAVLAMYYVAYRGIFYDVDIRETQTQLIENDRITTYADREDVMEDVVVAYGDTLEDALYSLGVPEDLHYIFETPFDPLGVNA